MENQNQESAPSQPNQRLGSPVYELQSPFSNEQTQKRNRPESPQNESHDVSAQSAKRSRNANLPPPSFPQEIIVEILANLPVKSLLRFRCVFKSWKSLISDPFFINKHLKRIQSDPKFFRKRVLINTLRPRMSIRYSIKSFNLSDTYEDSIVNTTEIEYPSRDVSRHDLIVGSCNGLICITVGEYTVFLVNPTLRVFKKLPFLRFKDVRDCYTVYGFGFVASVDDYKVVRFFCYRRRKSDDYKAIVSVYSLSTNRWRRIPNSPFGVPANQPVRHANGTLNWSFFRGRDISSFTIVSLDLARETYEEVMQPCYGDGGAGERSLGVLDGCLCLLCHYRRSYADVWVMKEYGKRESWTKLVTLPYTQCPRSAYFGMPLFVSGSGEILLRFGMDLILYDPKEDMFRMPAIPDDNNTFICQAAEVYEESLVSPIIINQSA
ncbi:hypothetical protein like AT3G23880 [Hibiscus trionum]|uniref:F-box domain-containing protein n=1 Tax=Hibiscus trionum TaxID=183268 RepID=A0A9W7IIY5_HIBTR|nr:hypothetical protein like AT3G23880 [Hibiscus trionum]